MDHTKSTDRKFGQEKSMANQQDEYKRIVGEKAAEYVKDGMTVGLGTGSTVKWTILKLGEMVADGLRIRGMPTSNQTELLATQCNIPLVDFSVVIELDITIDGADEVNPSLDLIKGGGGALLREKLVAAASKQFIVVADESKLVKNLGNFPLPVEIVRFAWETTEKRITDFGIEPTLRLKDNEPFVSDNGNYILDCRCGQIENAADLHARLKAMVGVVETGLFIGMTETVIVGGAKGARLVSRR